MPRDRQRHPILDQDHRHLGLGTGEGKPQPPLRTGQERPRRQLFQEIKQRLVRQRLRLRLPLGHRQSVTLRPQSKGTRDVATEPFEQSELVAG